MGVDCLIGYLPIKQIDSVSIAYSCYNTLVCSADYCYTAGINSE